MPNRTLGSVRLNKDTNEWIINAQPHVLLALKRVFPKLKKKAGESRLHHSPEACRDLEWFVDRYPLKVEPWEELVRSSFEYKERLERLESFNSPDYKPTEYQTALPPRDYQAYAIDFWRTNKFLLLGDPMGLGKTPVMACAMVCAEMRPALVVCDAHLPLQWERELKKFVPDLKVHIIQKSARYDLPPADVYICTYTKLARWSEFLRTFIKTVCYDEIQALRHEGSQKYNGAVGISECAEWTLGLSGTPIYGYGAEAFNLFEALKPGLLGDRDEFYREWLVPVGGGKYGFKDSNAFGSYIRENFYFLKRSRAEVGRELPALTRIPHIIEHDHKELDKIKASVSELARLILSETTSFEEKGQASRQFDLKLRQATGIAKAPYAAAFIRMLIESGEKPVCFAWHREVYNIMARELKDLKPVFYTGHESAKQKDEAVQKFISGEAGPIFLSTRSGAGLNGLQDVSDVTVHVELDWTDGVHEQNITRVLRDRSDGKPKGKVFSYFLMSDSGSDPILADILNLKSCELQGMINPGEEREFPDHDPERIKQMAKAYLAHQKK